MPNDECSSWYNRVGDFLMSVWDRRKEILDGNELVDEGQLKQPMSVRSMAQSAITFSV